MKTIEIPDDFISGEPFYVAHKLPKNLKQVRLIPISDVHYGNPLCSIKHFRNTRNFIRDNRDCYTVLNGDLIECVTKSSIGGLFDQVGTSQSQRDWIIKELEPIKDKVLGVTSGNHENRVYKETGFDISKDIAEALNAPYRPEGLILKVSAGSGNNSMKNQRYAYWIYFTHGYGGARTQGAKAAKGEKLQCGGD